MKSIINLLENIFEAIPLPFLEIWGRFAYLVGFMIMIFAYGGFTFRIGSKWGLARERLSWDTKSLVSIILTFVFIGFTGYIGSFIVLVPGAQTLESIKDLSVFMSILLFGFPALLAVPFAYSLADLMEGIPPEFILDWLPGYFINPACFWIAYQFFGKCPDFKKLVTWKWYLVFVLLFMTLEPIMWGYICSEKFTSEISYRVLVPALFFTTMITWLIAPFAMMIAYPVARKVRFFWAELEGRVQEVPIGHKEAAWVSGTKGQAALVHNGHGIPIRLFLTTPLILLVLIIAGITAFFTLRSSEVASQKLATQLHREISENINLRLDNYLELYKDKSESEKFAGIRDLLRGLSVADQGRVFIVNRNGELLLTASTASNIDLVEKNAIIHLKKELGDLDKLILNIQFKFDTLTAKPLAREAWLAQATPYQDKFGGHSDWVLITVMPESYYLEGVRVGNSQSAMIFAIAMVLALLIAAILASFVTEPIRRISRITQALAKGDFSQRAPGSRLMELGALSDTFNEMTRQLESVVENLTSEVKIRQKREKELEKSESKVKQSEARLHAAVKAANLGIWEWDIVNNILIWDEEMYRQYGLKEDSYIGGLQTWKNSIIEEDRERAFAEVQAVIRGEYEYDTEYRIKRPDGSIRYIKAAALTLRGMDGGPTRMIGMNYDITERRQAEQELEKYRHHLEELVDVRTLALKRKTEELEKNIKTTEELELLVKVTAGLAHEIDVQLNTFEQVAPNLDDQSTKVLANLKVASHTIQKNCQSVDNIIKDLI